ncbi:ABC transporter substrate-binding protein [Candidatus Poribacteria bacterium]|nr:ABC transporter substrate-binding protein [Candidatus Poribacteria bacterium]
MKIGKHLITLSLITFTLITSVTLLGFTFAPKLDNAKEIKIAVAAPLTGPLAAFGEKIKRGAELKAKEINAAGGVNGQTLTIIFEDDAGKDKEASSIAKRIATNRSILAVVGHFNSSCTLAGKSIYKRAGIVVLSPSSPNAQVCVGSEWTFRNSYCNHFQGALAAKHIKNVLGNLQKIAIFFDNDDYGRRLKDGFTDAAKGLGLEIVATEAYNRDNTDFRAQLISVKAKHPDLIFISGLHSHAGLIVAQARKAGITTPLFSADGVDSPDFLEIAGDAAEGVYVSTPFTFELGGTKAQKMAMTFEEEYGVAPNAWAALTYDSVGMIAEAIEKGGENRKAIRDYLAGISTPEEGYVGVTGLTYFDEHGACVKPAAVKTSVKIVRDNTFIPIDDPMLDIGIVRGLITAQHHPYKNW